MKMNTNMSMNMNLIMSMNVSINIHMNMIYHGTEGAAHTRSVSSS